MNLEDRALGALEGLAIGDALGMPTQMLSRAEVVRIFGPVLKGLERPPSGHPVAEGMEAGRVTDDTDQALLLAHEIIRGGGLVDPDQFAHALLAWEQMMRARGSLDLLGPSTKRAIAALVGGGDIGEVGSSGDTNGAAMRIAPIGIAVSARHLKRLVESVVQASRMTHDTSVALAGASAVAAAVSVGIEGATMEGVVQMACEAAIIGSRHGHWVAGADVANRIQWATQLVEGMTPEQVASSVPIQVGTSLATQESVPAAFAVASAFPRDPWLACRVAASLGGDSDTIAAITGAILGALNGATAFPQAARDEVTRVNALELEPIVAQLLVIRRGPTT